MDLQDKHIQYSSLWNLFIFIDKTDEQKLRITAILPNTIKIYTELTSNGFLQWMQPFFLVCVDLNWLLLCIQLNTSRQLSLDFVTTSLGSFIVVAAADPTVCCDYQ